MRMREFIARMGSAKQAEALRCPYEWYEPVKGRPLGCTGECDKCIRQFAFPDGAGGTVGLRKLMATMTATKMARALRCPFDWFAPLLDKKSPCERGEDCNACIQHFLIGCDTSDFYEK